MRRSILFISIYFSAFLIVSVPLILNIRINELSNKISDLNNEIFILERQEMLVNLKHNEKYSISVRGSNSIFPIRKHSIQQSYQWNSGQYNTGLSFNVLYEF